MSYSINLSFSFFVLLFLLWHFYKCHHLTPFLSMSVSTCLNSALIKYFLNTFILIISLVYANIIIYKAANFRRIAIPGQSICRSLLVVPCLASSLRDLPWGQSSNQTPNLSISAYCWQPSEKPEASRMLQILELVSLARLAGWER